MSQEKYIGMDVHAATISAAVRNAEGKLLMECVLESKAATILEFIQGLRGTLAAIVSLRHNRGAFNSRQEKWRSVLDGMISSFRISN